MTDRLTTCANCGSSLQNACAVCPRCDKALRADNADPSQGVYQCPVCTCRFDKPVLVWWPEKAPWYWPQDQKTQCPHCKVLLRDRARLRTSWREGLAWVALALASRLSPWRPGTQILLIALLFAFYFVRLIKAKNSVPAEEQRFGIED
jgi:hypothetical protein